jgi:hypothetical protein
VRWKSCSRRLQRTDTHYSLSLYLCCALHLTSTYRTPSTLCSRETSPLRGTSTRPTASAAEFDEYGAEEGASSGRGMRGYGMAGVRLSLPMPNSAIKVPPGPRTPVFI